MSATPTKPNGRAPERGGIDDKQWFRWIMQTARTWDDIKGVVNKTGVESIDNDHRQMTEVVLEINSLADLCQSGEMGLGNIKEQGAILERLYAYASRHFDREIMIIQKYDLPNLDAQKKQHVIFLELLQRHMDSFREGRIAVSEDLKTEVLEWWVNHINTLDTHTFSRENWTNAAIREAKSWEDVVEIIKYMGIETLDREHKEMTEIALELIQYTEEGEVDRAGLQDVFDRLRDCARRHFDHEEHFIARYNLPDLDKQEKQHERFFSMLDDFWKDVEGGNKEAIRKIKTSVLQWWITHINVVDYNAFSLDLWSAQILGNASSWDEASQFIHHTGEHFVDNDHYKITNHIIGIDKMIEETSDLEPEIAKSFGGAYFETMLDLCSKHFKNEEEKMRREGYSSFALHKEQHDRFLVALERHRDDFSQGRTVASKKMKHFFLNWWVGHIKEFDQRAFSGLAETASEWEGLSEKSMWELVERGEA